MTLHERQELIVTTTRILEEGQTLSAASLAELVCAKLARLYGLAVTPDEVTRTLAQAAGFEA